MAITKYCDLWRSQQQQLLGTLSALGLTAALVDQLRWEEDFHHEGVSIKGGSVRFTPEAHVHAILHEAAHVLAISPELRPSIVRDVWRIDSRPEANDESIVMFMQVAIAAEISDYGSEQMLRDMVEGDYYITNDWDSELSCLEEAREWYYNNKDYESKFWRENYAHLLKDGD